MSTDIYTELYLSPNDWDKPAVREVLEGFDVEFQSYDTLDPVTGTIRVIAIEHESFSDLCTLSAMGIAFWAYYDSRQESDGAEFGFVSWGKTNMFARIDENSLPTVAVHDTGKVNPEELKAAKDYWRLMKRARAAILRKSKST